MHRFLSPIPAIAPAHITAPAYGPATAKLAEYGSAGYEIMAQHIEEIFKKHYDAEITVSYPRLIGLVDDADNVKAALGVRRAFHHKPLFLENYLELPAEKHLSTLTGQDVQRHAIAEAGNLASTGKNGIIRLLYALACHLDQEGVEYIIFTGTSLLRRYLHGLGMYPLVLAEANPEKLGDNAACWGSYYDTRPKVMAGSVRTFRTGLECHLYNKEQIW